MRLLTLDVASRVARIGQAEPHTRRASRGASEPKLSSESIRRNCVKQWSTSTPVRASDPLLLVHQEPEQGLWHARTRRSAHDGKIAGIAIHIGARIGG